MWWVSTRNRVRQAGVNMGRYIRRSLRIYHPSSSTRAARYHSTARRRDGAVEHRRLSSGGPAAAHMRPNSQEPGPLLRKFDEDCARLSVVRDTMVRSLSSQHVSALQRQAVAMGSLQRDLKILQADLETVKEGLGEQLSSISAASKPHWKFVPVQRAATSTERDAALALQRRWRRRPCHTHGWHYSTPAERQAVMRST